MYVPIVFAGQAKLANEKDMLAGQVKKLMRDVAKVIDIMMTYVPLYFWNLLVDECFDFCNWCSLLILLWKY